MKHRSMLLALIGSLLFMLIPIACTGGSKQSVSGEEQSLVNLQNPETETTNVETISKTDVKETEADSCSVSLVPGKKWTFHYTSPTFPCDTASDCVIKGFAVEGDQTFYILSGKSVCISRFDGTKLVASMQLEHSLDDSYNALLQVTSDSIYYIDEQAKTLYVIDKESLQPTSAYALPIG